MKICLLHMVYCFLFLTVHAYEKVIDVYQENGFVGMQEYILQNAIDSNVKDENEEMLLHTIIKRVGISLMEKEKLVLHFVHAGVAVDTFCNGHTPLYLAILFDCKRLIKEFLIRGADCNKVQKNGHTPFSKLCEYFNDDAALLTQFLDYGACINQILNFDNGVVRTPLVLAILNKHTNLVKYLFECGVDVTTVHSLCPPSSVSTEIRMVLLAYGVLGIGQSMFLQMKNILKTGQFCTWDNYMLVSLHAIACNKHIAFNKKHFFWQYCGLEKDVQKRIQFFIHALVTLNYPLVQEMFFLPSFLPSKKTVLQHVSLLLHKKFLKIYDNMLVQQQLFQSIHNKDCVIMCAR